MEKTTRSSKERVADTYWPLMVYLYETLYGPPFAHVMAHFFGCQPTSWFKADISKLKHDNIEAFLSPAYRRWFRNSIKRTLKAEITEARRKGIDPRQMARESLSQLYEGLREELSGSDIEELSSGEIKADWPPFTELEKEMDRIDLSHIPKANQLEAQQNRKAEEIVKDAKGAAQFFPVHSTIDARLRNEILVQVGGNEDYALTVAQVLAEAETNPLSIADSIGGKALIGSFHLEKLGKELEAMQFPRGFRIIGKAIGKCMKLSMPQQGSQIAALLIGKMLVAQFAEQPYSKYRKKSLEELAEKGVEPSDSHVEQWLSEMEDRSVLESSLKLLPASQREDSYFFIEAHKQGKTPEELRRELGDRKYKSKQRNLERAGEGLRDLRRSGKLDL